VVVVARLLLHAITITSRLASPLYSADEFNRLVPEVLSVCSVQFKAVCDGIRAKRSTVVIEGDEVHLDWSAGAFITMNPGYLGALPPVLR